MYPHYNGLFHKWGYGRMNVFSPGLYHPVLSQQLNRPECVPDVGSNDKWAMRVINIVARLAHSEVSGYLDEDGTVLVTETRKLCDSEGCGWGWRKQEVMECEPEWWWVWREARFTLALLTALTLHLIMLRLHSCVLLALSLPTPTACCTLTLTPSIRKEPLGLNTSAASWLVKAKLLHPTKVQCKLCYVAWRNAEQASHIVHLKLLTL